MTLYALNLTVPASTGRDNSVARTVEVDKQLVDRATVFIDPGSNGEVNVQIQSGEALLIPAIEGDPITKPGQTGPVTIDKRLPGVPNEVTVRAWAPAADFSHEVIVQIVTEEEREDVSDVRIVGRGRQGTRGRPTPTPEDIMSAGGDE